MTIELPEPLIHRMKIRAVNEHKKLKEIVAELLEQGLRKGATSSGNLPKPLKLRRGFTPNAEDIETAIANGRRY